MFVGNLQLRSSFHLMSNTSLAPQLEIFILLNSSLSKPASCDSKTARQSSAAAAIIIPSHVQHKSSSPTQNFSSSGIHPCPNRLHVILTSSDFGQGQFRCFDTVSRRPYPCFSIALKVILSLSDHHKILTCDWLWIEVCQNAVFSKIGFHYDNNKQKTLKPI